MKKLLILSAILVSGAFAANAQGQMDTTVTANIGVNVADVKTITIEAGENPLFTLATAADYNNAATSTGIATDVKTSIKVVSRGGYKVKAQLGGNLTTTATTDGRKNIPGSALKIAVDGTPVKSSGELSPTPNNDYRAFQDAATPSVVAELVKSPAATGGTRGTTFDVAYKISGFEDVVNLAIGNFTSTITYTIEAN